MGGILLNFMAILETIPYRIAMIRTMSKDEVNQKYIVFTEIR
jgi:hypothetical protein